MSKLTEQKYSRKVLVFALAVSLLLTSFLGYQIAQLTFSGTVDTVPIYLEPFHPYTYLINKNSTHYIVKNGTSGEIFSVNTNLTALLNSIIAVDSTYFFKPGTYAINYRITIDEHGVEFIAENTEGTIFDMGPYGEFWFEKAGVNLEQYLFANIHFEGTHATKPAINFYGIDSDKRVGQLTLDNCHFDYWCLGQTELINYCVNFTNYDYIRVLNCHFANAPMRWATHGWASGNSFVTNGFIGVNNWDYDVHDIWLITMVGCQLETRGNQFYAKASSNDGYQPINGINITTVDNSRAWLDSYSDRAEFVNFLYAKGYDGDWTVRDCNIAGGRFVQTGDNNYTIHLDSNVERSKIVDSLFSVSGTNTTAIWIDATASGNSTNIISDNNLVAGDYFIRGSGTCALYNNQGQSYGIIGYPFTTTSSYKMLDWNGDLDVPVSGRTYRNYHSPKTIYIDGGTVTNVEVNGNTVFTSTGCTVQVGYYDTFKCAYTGNPTFKVFVDG